MWRDAKRWGVGTVGPDKGSIAVWSEDTDDVVYFSPEQAQRLFKLLEKYFGSAARE